MFELHAAAPGRLRQPNDVGDREQRDRTLCRCGSAPGNISFERDTFTFNYPKPPSALLDEFRKYYGPTMNAFEAAERNGRADELQKELEDLFNRENKSGRSDVTSIPATFLRVTVSR